MKRRVPLVAVLPALSGVLLSGCLPGLDETSVETIRRPGAPELTVSLDRGSLSIREHLGAEIEVEIRRTAQALSRQAAQTALAALVVDFEREEGSGALAITGRRATAGAFRPWEELGLHLEIAVPAGTAVTARTASGRIELHGLTGPTEATTASGRIVANGLRSPTGTNQDPVRLRTADGRIEGEGLEGSFRVVSGDGRIRLEGRLQQVTALSADGRIAVDVRGGGASAEGEWLLRTGSGRIQLTLPESANAVMTAVGRPTTDDRHDFSDWRREGPIALATLGDGSGPRIHLRTGDGSIRVGFDGRD